MPHFSIRDLLILIASFGVLFGARTWAYLHDSRSFVVFAADAPGPFYSWLIPGAGILAFFLCWKAVWKATTIGQSAASLPIATLPALIGVFGMLHAFVNMYQMFMHDGTHLRLVDHYYSWSTVFFIALFGMAVSLPSYLMIAGAMYYQAMRRPRSESSPS